MDFSICAASLDDAAAAAEVIARAIRISCIADHGNDETKIADWLADKSQADVEFLVGDPSSACFVAQRENEILGFAAVSAGVLLQLYVDPGASGLGIGRALLETAEQRPRDDGCERITLDSTKAAQPFYRRMGYTDALRPGSNICGIVCHPMEKRF